MLQLGLDERRFKFEQKKESTEQAKTEVALIQSLQSLGFTAEPIKARLEEIWGSTTVAPKEEEENN